MSDLIETKAAFNVTDAGAITGTAWVFATPDRVGDRIMKGAFKSAPATLPMLWAHDQSQTIGVWNEIRETDTGLEVRGQLLVNDVARAKEVRALIKSGAVSGLSIGFISKKSFPRKGGGRDIHELEVVETSIVSIPAHPQATISSMKHLKGDTMDFETETDVADTTDITATVDALKADLAAVTKNYSDLQAAHDKLATRFNRPGIVTTKTADDTAALEKKAFRAFVAGDTKALTLGDQGASVAPTEFNATVQRVLIQASPFRQFASTMPISNCHPEWCDKSH